MKSTGGFHTEGNLWTGTLTHSFFQGGWHFPENPKIDGDTDPFLKSGKILNHHAAPARICISKI